MLPQPIHRPRNLILFALAVLAALTALALVRAPQGHAVEYPYPYPEEPAPNPTPNPTNPYPNPYPTPTPEPTPQPPTGMGSGTVRVVKEAQNKELGHKILTNNRGRTLYSLSVEKSGKFICDVSACLSIWKPLTVKAGRQAGRSRPPGDDRPPRRQDPGHLSRPAALQVHGRHQARRRLRRGHPGRRRLARRRRQTLRSPP